MITRKCVTAVLTCLVTFSFGAGESRLDFSIFDRENLVAWCIVPFDAKQRGPQERAAMITRLGLKQVAYDWRAQHIPTFEQELLAYKEHGIELVAFWTVHEGALALCEKHGLRPQVWMTAPSPPGDSREQRVKAAAEALLPAVKRVAQAGGKFGLYNHGGWGGEPENLISVCQYLRRIHNANHVGIVYNFHHGHDHIDSFPAALAAMKPYLLCLNINGMDRGGDQKGRKILAVGHGAMDLEMLRTVGESGYDGPIGILGHRTDADVEKVLADNLAGLDWALKELKAPGSGGERPVLRAPLK